MGEDAKTETAYGAIARDVDVEATPLEGERARRETLAAKVRGRKTLGLAAVALAGVGAVARARAPEMFTASLGRAPLVPALGLADGAYYARGGKHRLRDPFLRVNGQMVPMKQMTDAQKSANVVNWCRFRNVASNGNFRCGVNCRQDEENGSNAPEVFYIGSTPADDDGNVYRTISRKGEDGNMYVCYSDWSRNNGWNRKVMKCPTSGSRAVLTNSTSLPEGAKLTISEVPAAKKHTQNVEYDMGTLYTFVNKDLAGRESGKGLCRDFGSSIACHARQNNIADVNAQFEFIPVVPDDASGDVSACPA